MLLMVEKGIRGAICNSVHWYVKASNIYINNYDKNNEPSYLKYWDAKNLYRWIILQKLPVDGIKLVD